MIKSYKLHLNKYIHISYPLSTIQLSSRVENEIKIHVPLKFWCCLIRPMNFHILKIFQIWLKTFMGFLLTLDRSTCSRPCLSSGFGLMMRNISLSEHPGVWARVNSHDVQYLYSRKFYMYTAQCTGSYYTARPISYRIISTL